MKNVPVIAHFCSQIKENQFDREGGSSNIKNAPHWNIFRDRIEGEGIARKGGKSVLIKNKNLS